MTYPGGKNGAGVYQTIINLIPPHRVYIEPFAGGAAILRRKRPARSSVVIDADASVARELLSSLSAVQACTVIHGDGIRFLREYEWRGDEFVYCDPPYLLSTLRSGPIYRESLSDHQHRQLLSVLLTMPAAVMLSGYRSVLYNRLLQDWYRVDYQAVTRGGSLATESLWMNYAAPALLHDDRYVGKDFRERERIKRKRERWTSRLMAMPAAERNAVYSSLVEAMRARASQESSSAASMRPGTAGEHRQA